MTAFFNVRVSEARWFHIIAIGWLLLITHQPLFHTFAPRSTWFNYEDVVFLGRTGDTGLLFQSYRSVYRTTDFLFEDTLYCDKGNGNGFTNFGIMKGSLSDVPKDLTSAQVARPWVWNIGRLPPIGAVCKLRYAPAVRLSMGITKEQVGWSETFIITE